MLKIQRYKNEQNTVLYKHYAMICGIKCSFTMNNTISRKVILGLNKKLQALARYLTVRIVILQKDVKMLKILMPIGTCTEVSLLAFSSSSAIYSDVTARTHFIVPICSLPYSSYF